MLHSHTSRRHIRTSERLYSEPSLAYLEPLELKEHLKMKAERGRYSESRATAYRGYDTTKDVKHLSVKLKNAGVRVVPPGETYLTNALKNTYFTPSPTDPTASGAAASSSSTMQPPQPPSQQPESLKGFHPSLTVHQQPIEVYEYLSREDEATKQRELDMNSMFDLEAVEEEAAEMEQQQNNFVGTRASKKDRRDGERRWFAPSHEAGPNSPRHWRGKKPTKGTVKNPNQHEKPWEFSRYKTDKKKHAVENPAVKREPPGRL
ncbi:unnamed protein product [Amoebophrya sp. A120]|nr:unnamed protein product [Amoebophrya sp. A120]|eukprot:GSA120T00021846001.1